MIIDRNLSRYVVHEDESILNALKHINVSKLRMVFVVLKNGTLVGTFTDGDFRRWLISEESPNLDRKVSQIANKNHTSASIDASLNNIKSLFSDKIECIPLVDDTNRIKGVALQKTKQIDIGDFSLVEDGRTFVIAEVGNNHNGSIDFAKELVDKIIEAGADCAKFQLRNMEQLYSRSKNGSHKDSADLGVQYTLDLLEQFQLKDDELMQVFDYCKKRGVLPLCTPWDTRSFEILREYGMSAYKVASADMTNHQLLQKLAEAGKPIICSTGMSTEFEIKQTVRLLQNLAVQYVLLHCNATYPTPFSDVNLQYMDRLKKLGDCLVGYSGHERGIFVPIAAVARGAKVIEKHFTLDKKLEGNDHKISLLPEEFKDMVRGIRQVEETMDTVSDREMTQGEIINRENLAKSIIINCDASIGELVSEEMLEIRSPGQGIQPNRYKELIGKRLVRNMNAGSFFFESDVNGITFKPKDYNFSRPWGIPVRYHDFMNMKSKTNVDLLEIHLSYQDMELDFKQYIQEPVDLDLVVHAPELFEGDHLLDLCTDDNAYRNTSIDHMQRVIDLTNELKPFFYKSSKPLIITNVGGFTKQRHLSRGRRPEYYGRLEESLAQLELGGVEIIPQTMPPFPWHFGGQQYHNLFIDPEDITAFCRKNNMRICLDISHTKLACNFFKRSMQESLKLIAPYVAHMHIADAKGNDGEGLQICHGEIDWKVFVDVINEYCPEASFIPEIWQGHKNEGEGFYEALDKLEGFLF